jgi:hypothetical protein
LGVTAFEDVAILGGDGFAEVAVPLGKEEKFSSGKTHLKNLPKGAAFEVVEAGALLDGLANELAEILSEGEQAIRLACNRRRCDDHATASMRLVVKNP